MAQYYFNVSAGDTYGDGIEMAESVSIPAFEVHDFAGHPDDMAHVIFKPCTCYDVKSKDGSIFTFDQEMYVDINTISENAKYPVIEGRQVYAEIQTVVERDATVTVYPIEGERRITSKLGIIFDDQDDQGAQMEVANHATLEDAHAYIMDSYNTATCTYEDAARSGMIRFSPSLKEKYPQVDNYHWTEDPEVDTTVLPRKRELPSGIPEPVEQPDEPEYESPEYGNE